MTRGANIGYTTSLTSVTSSNSWTTYQQDFETISSEVFFSLHFSSARLKTSVIRLEPYKNVRLKMPNIYEHAKNVPEAEDTLFL